MAEYGQQDELHYVIPLLKRREIGTVYDRMRLTPKNYRTSDNYEYFYVDARLHKVLIITIKDLHASQIVTYTIDGCIDPANGNGWYPIVTATDIDPVSNPYATQSITNPYAFYRIGIKNKTAGQATNVVIHAMLRST